MKRKYTTSALILVRSFQLIALTLIVWICSLVYNEVKEPNHNYFVDMYEVQAKEEQEKQANLNTYYGR